MDSAQDAHARQFVDPSFHFVPRKKMMQIQSGCIDTMCQVLDKNNRTNTWQRKDACVVEQCMSALALHVHRRPEVGTSTVRTSGDCYRGSRPSLQPYPTPPFSQVLAR
ncbi:unnamed protein product [Ectocarpus sp. 4 AP-2014]